MDEAVLLRERLQAITVSARSQPRAASWGALEGLPGGGRGASTSGKRAVIASLPLP